LKIFKEGISMNKFQRVGSNSNTEVGRDFEITALEYFKNQGKNLYHSFALPCGVGEEKKSHTFDLGANNECSEKIIVECKSYTWTESGNVPSAKITTLDQAMFYFLIAPKEYRKILFLLKHINPKTGETLGHYYIRTRIHLIPSDVEILEYDKENKTVNRLL
jgi:hypothetical protein